MAVQNKLDEVSDELDLMLYNRRIEIENKAISRIDKDPSYFYKYQRRFGKMSEPIGDLKTIINGKEILVTDNKDKADALNHQYSSVWSQPDENFKIHDSRRFFAKCDECEREQNHYCDEDVTNDMIINNAMINIKQTKPTISDINFTAERIEGFIDEIKTNSSTGPDGISAKMMKGGKVNIAKMLAIIGEKSMNSNSFPTKLKNMFIIGIFKGGDRNSPAQYRPIALSSHLAKTLERVVREQLVEFLESEGLMDPGQHGSRSGRSTLSQLLEHHHNVINEIYNGSNVDVVYVDFAKAFDKVDHGILAYKLRSLGIIGNLGSWLFEFVTGRTQYVTVSGSKSEPVLVKSGIPQGSVLGPIIFLLYVQDIRDKDNKLSTIYVDDLKLAQAIYTELDVENFQIDLDTLYEWGRRNNCVFNNDKFLVMRYGKNTMIKNDTLYFSPSMYSVIGELENCRDLGVQLENTGHFNIHINNIIKKVRKIIGWVMRSFFNRSIPFLKKMWVSLIRPHIDYCSQLWSPGEGPLLDSIERLQYDYTKLSPETRNLTYTE